MLLIDCPWCGKRDEMEFRCGGERADPRPAFQENGDGDAARDLAWTRYLNDRANVRGLHQERWLHAFGCRQWFVVTRNTATHAIQGVAPMDSLTADDTPHTAVPPVTP